MDVSSLEDNVCLSYPSQQQPLSLECVSQQVQHVVNQNLLCSKSATATELRVCVTASATCCQSEFTVFKVCHSN